MAMRSRIKGLAAIWLAAEIIALATAVHVWGWPITLALGFTTSVIGMLVIRNLGRATMRTFKQAFETPAGMEIAVPSSGALKLAAGILLILPGFVSDLAGLLLLAPFIREPIANLFLPQSRGNSATNGVVDLNPDEWRAGQAHNGSPSCEPSPGMLPGGPNDAHSRRRDDE